MPSYRAPRGTRDLLPAERATWARAEASLRELAGRYGYREIETPLFEQSAVFERGVGAVTDIVEKELFRVSPSRGDEREPWALRPEATAGIVRAYIEHGMHTQPQPVRLSLYGPMFRYDRPQAGRYRQFYQWDIEAIGDAGPAIDAEIIELGVRFYRSVGLDGVEARLNTIGDPVCRPGYLKALTAYYETRIGEFPDLARARLVSNPLRLLDSKDPVMVEINRGAPAMTAYLCDGCSEHFAAVRAHLEALDVPYRLAPEIVRGLDYYTRTTFEYVLPGAEGQQDALGGGGRYDGLVELLGGKPTPAIGYALGMDRIVNAMIQAETARVQGGTGAAGAASAAGAPLAVVVGADPDDTIARLRIATELRAAGLPVRADIARRKLGRQLEAAVRDGARFAVIVGDESGDGLVQLRDLGAASQKPVALSALPALLKRKATGG
jgi:histidyl-tRNA synthetase